MAVLIIGKPDDLTSVYMQEKLIHRGIDAPMFDTTKFPTEVVIHLDINDRAAGYFQESPYKPRYALGEILGVFRRWSDGVVVPDEETDPLRRRLVCRNLESFIDNFYGALSHAQWVNTQAVTEEHRHKGKLLERLFKVGIRIPATQITNSPEAVQAFYEQWQGQVIFKPVFSWASTEKLEPEHLTPQSLARLSNMPITLQEYIPGVDCRIYVVGDDIFAMEIHSQTLDFRDDAYAPRVPIQLPAEVQTRCHQIMSELGLVYAGIDMRRTPEGEYVFF